MVEIVKRERELMDNTVVIAGYGGGRGHRSDGKNKIRNCKTSIFK